MPLSGNKVRVSPFPNVLEEEPNNSVGEARLSDTPLPVAFNGIIGEPGDQDWFRFTAKKGQRYDVRVYARKLRSPIDSVIYICNKDGRSLASNDDSGGPIATSAGLCRPMASTPYVFVTI